MAVPLRKAAGSYETAIPRQPARKQARQAGKTNPAPKRLVRRQVQSNAANRYTITWLLGGMFFVFLLMGFSGTFGSAGISRLNYNMNTIRDENEQLLLENEKIRGQIAELRSLDRIEEIAVSDLGMIKNEKIEYMVLSGAAVAEGKTRAVDYVSDEGQKSAKPPKTAMDYILALLNR